MKKFSEVFNSKENLPKTFEGFLDLFAPEVGEIVNGYLNSSSNADIERYLYAPLYKYSQNGGRRHRPIVCFLACKAVGGNEDLATSAAAALEHFHTAALIHDDIADCATTRRDQPCLYLEEGEGLAVNMGDLAISMVNGTVMKDKSLSQDLRVRVVNELLDMTTYTVEGQAMDIGWARDKRFDIDVQDYLCMATRKTAHYSGGVPIAVGAIIGGADEKTVEGLRQFGLDAGLAFQIQDDLLNIISAEEDTTKDFLSDIAEGKRTLMVVHALQHSAQKDKQRLVDILSNKEKDPAVLRQAVSIMEQAGSIEYARSYATMLTNRAKENLLGILPPSYSRDILHSMADWFVSRLQ